MRQEGKKVYMRPSITDPLQLPKALGLWIPYKYWPEDKEFIIYDFSLMTGQYLKLCDDLPDDYVFFGNKYIFNRNNVTEAFDRENQRVQEIGTSHVIENIGAVESSSLFPFPYVRVSYGFNLYCINDLTLEKVINADGNVLYSGVSTASVSQSSLYVVDGEIKIESEGDWRLTIFDTQGKTVMKQKGNAAQTISLSELSSGLYIARLQADNDVHTLKIVK